MRLLKRGGVYYIEFSRGRKRSLKTRNGGLARKIFDEALKETLLGRMVKAPPKRVSLVDFARQYIKAREHQKAANTLDIDDRHLGHLQDFLPKGICLPDIEARQCESFIAYLQGEKKFKSTTVNIAARTLKAAFNKAVEWDYINISPFSRIKPIKIQNPLPRAMTAAEVVRLLKAAEGDKNRFREYLLTCLYTAGRRESVARLRWEDFKEYEGQWTVTFQKTKNVALTIPLADKLRAEIFAHKAAKGPVFPAYHHEPTKASKHFRRYADAAGLQGYKLHDLRHTAATFMILKGIPTRIVQQILGHSTIAMTEVYTRVASEHLRQGVNSLNF